jgi:hypothetical protein
MLKAADIKQEKPHVEDDLIRSQKLHIANVLVIEIPFRGIQNSSVFPLKPNMQLKKNILVRTQERAFSYSIFFSKTSFIKFAN